MLVAEAVGLMSWFVQSLVNQECVDVVSIIGASPNSTFARGLGNARLWLG